MNDLALAMAVIGVIAVLAGFLAAWRFHPRGDHLILGVTVTLVGGLLYIWFLVGKLFWADWIPSSAAISWSNLSPVPLAIAAGWTWRLPDRPLWRRALFSSLLAMVAAGSLLWPLLGPIVRPPQPAGNEWYGKVAMQTRWANCSPAAAATLLRTADVVTSEAEMVDLCLTDSRGTTALGLYRGLKLKADQHGLGLRVVHPLTAKDVTGDLVLDEAMLPAVLVVGLPQGGVEDPRYERDWGWIPGMGHTVVCFGREPFGEWLIGDPSVGVELWNDRDMRVLWTGEAIGLVQP